MRNFPDLRTQDELRKINIFGGEHAENVIEVSNLFEAFRASAELTLKVSPSMETKIGTIPLENQCFRW